MAGFHVPWTEILKLFFNFPHYFLFIILVQYTQTESIRLRHFTTRLDSHGVVSRANRLPGWRIGNRGNDSCRLDRIESNRQHFQETLHSPPEVKIREIKIHEHNIFNPPSRSRSAISSKSTSSMSNRQKGKRFVPIRWNRIQESISG